jgi:hypothetical protein
MLIGTDLNPAQGCVLFFGCVVAPLSLFVGFVAFSIWWRRSNAQKAKKAWAAYQESLAKLRDDPTNPALREEALQRGRQHAYFSRSRAGTYTIDEVTIANDINAACAAAGTAARARDSSLQERLQQLETMRAQGLLSDDEYADGRRRILAEM